MDKEAIVKALESIMAKEGKIYMGFFFHQESSFVGVDTEELADKIINELEAAKVSQN